MIYSNSSKFEYDKMARVKDHSRVEDMEDDNNYAIFVSFVEIYNNYIYDLLEDLQYDPITGYKWVWKQLMCIF